MKRRRVFVMGASKVTPEQILAEAAQVNHFWLNLPYTDLSFTYQFVQFGFYEGKKEQPYYLAWVAFKAPDKARLQELWGLERLKLLTVICNAGEYAILSGGEVTRSKEFGFPASAIEPLYALKLAHQLFPPSPAPVAHRGSDLEPRRKRNRQRSGGMGCRSKG